MIRQLLIVILAANCGACRGWSGRDTLLEVGFAGVTTVDAAQSVGIGAACAETNPLVGHCGEHLGPVMAGSIVLHAAVSALLPAGGWRSAWQLLTLGTESGVVYNNYQQGWRP